MILKPKIPRVYLPLLAPARYKAAWGGRGSGKSHFFAEKGIIRCASRKTRMVCIREVQNSIDQSVRQLLIDKIFLHGLERQFEIQKDRILCPHGGMIIFKGMQAYNAINIKSLEGYDVAWVEEAQSLSGVSLRLLRPTIRAPGSELWFSWNPVNDDDPVDEFFRGNPPKDAVVVRANYQDNPWFPEELKDEMAHDRATDPEMASHVWDGGYQIITEGSYYGKLLADAESEGRIGDYPYDPALPVFTAWDIGVDDYTAIWFLQENGNQVRALAYFEASGCGPEQIIPEALPEILADQSRRAAGIAAVGREYRYGNHFLPHDVTVREWGGGAKTRLQTLKEQGVWPINVGVAMNPADRINATRRLLPMVYFDQAGCALGIKRLRGYSRKFSSVKQMFMGPDHNEHSHGADAFGEFAVNCRLSQIVVPKIIKPRDIWATQDREEESWKTA